MDLQLNNILFHFHFSMIVHFEENPSRLLNTLFVSYVGIMRKTRSKELL